MTFHLRHLKIVILHATKGTIILTHKALCREMEINRISLWMRRSTYINLDNKSSIAADRLLEICGVFIVMASGEIILRYCRNYSSDILSYKIRRRDIVGFLDTRYICGIFHSHVLSDTSPSQEDINRGFFTNYMMVHSDLNGSTSLWSKMRKPTAVQKHRIIIRDSLFKNKACKKKTTRTQV